MSSNQSLYIGTLYYTGVVSAAALTANLVPYVTNNMVGSLTGNLALTAANLVVSGTNSYFTSNTTHTGANLNVFGGTLYCTSNLILGTSLVAVGLAANGTYGAAGQVLASNGTATYWSTASGFTPTAQYTWTNTQTFSSNLVIGTGFSANGTFGSNGQVLASNGSTVYWANAVSVRQQFTGTGACTTFAVTSGFVNNYVDVYVNGVKMYNGTDVTVSASPNVVFGTAPPNGALIDVVGQSGTGVNVIAAGAVNTANQYVWTNTETFNANVVVAAANLTYSGGLLYSGSNVNFQSVFSTNTSQVTLAGNVTVSAANLYFIGTNAYFASNTTFNANVTYNSNAYMGAAAALTIGAAVVNSTTYTGTSWSANNASYLGGVVAASWAQLASPAFTGSVTVTNSIQSGNLVVTTKSGNYTLTAADSGTVLPVTAAATITVPSTLPVGFRCMVTQTGTGNVVFSGSGLTLYSRTSAFTITAQYGSASVFVLSSSQAIVDGAI